MGVRRRTGRIDVSRGGLGVFGAIVRVQQLPLDVVTPQLDPVEGTFRFVGTPAESTATPVG